jgi:endonuclease G
MDALEKRLARLRSFNAWVQGGDPELGEENADHGMAALEAMAPGVPIEDRVALESISLRRTRPVLAIHSNVTTLQFVDPADSEIWKARLEGGRPFLDKAIRAVGRINLTGADLDWIGTGWLVADNTLVTNRHVAERFVARDGSGFTFSMGPGGRIAADIDFLQEVDNLDALVFKLVRPLHVEDASGPDLSFFEVEVVSGNTKLAAPIALAAQPRTTNNAATIGYPAYDSRIREPELMEDIFGKVYNKKRLAPGGVTKLEEIRLLHNCSTLGGNSGSAVVDLDSGEALGLHFSGKFLDTNYAVRADVVKRVLDDVRAGRRSSRVAAQPETASRASATAAPINLTVPRSRGSVSMTVPLTITVSLGEPTTTPPARQRVAPVAALGDGSVDGEEAVAADYSDRQGYSAAFLGDGELSVALPAVDQRADDVLDFELEGKSETVLRYDHYSVVMSRSRRMCFFSAVNIDGALSKKSKRVGWKWDPRIPKKQQIMNECYGNPPKKFSRGHMTRREDPGWGKTAEQAKRGNEDSMHVTNTTPQMQAFNAPIWLELEDYALDHTKEDHMKVSVFTGPYFTDDDPTMYGVRIPRAFWKIIAFIHDETGKLCATGYEMDQQQSLPAVEEEFVFGALTSSHLNVAAQVPIRSIEAKSGLRFGRLAEVDPLAEAQEAIGDEAGVPLASLEQIRFVR